VQIHERRRAVDFAEVSPRLQALGTVKHNSFVLKFWREPYELTLFPDGRDHQGHRGHGCGTKPLRQIRRELKKVLASDILSHSPASLVVTIRNLLLRGTCVGRQATGNCRRSL
jgi:hypothetical protein